MLPGKVGYAGNVPISTGAFMEAQRNGLPMVPVPYPWTLAEALALHVSQTLTVSSCSTTNLPLVLNAADIVHGSFKIFPAYGYGDRELRFRVLDSTDTVQYSQPIILDLGTVVNGASFDFTARNSGNHVLVFDNECGSSGSNSQKEIRLTYEITNPTVAFSKPSAAPVS